MYDHVDLVKIFEFDINSILFEMYKFICVVYVKVFKTGSSVSLITCTDTGG